jgi:hypothetical protein
VKILAKVPWKPLDLLTLPRCNIVACDPSLTALGIVCLKVDDSGVSVSAVEKLSTAPTERNGWEDTFFRALLIEAELDTLFDRWFDSETAVPGETRENLYAVCELPPTGGGDFVRTEAAVLSGFAFRLIAKEYKIKQLQGVTPQSHKKLISGNHLASKKEHHEHLKLLLSNLTGGDNIKNAATRDAVSVGLYAAHRLATTQSRAT